MSKVVSNGDEAQLEDSDWEINTSSRESSLDDGEIVKRQDESPKTSSTTATIAKPFPLPERISTVKAAVDEPTMTSKNQPKTLVGRDEALIVPSRQKEKVDDFLQREIILSQQDDAACDARKTEENSVIKKNIKSIEKSEEFSESLSFVKSFVELGGSSEVQSNCKYDHSEEAPKEVVVKKIIKVKKKKLKPKIDIIETSSNSVLENSISSFLPNIDDICKATNVEHISTTKDSECNMVNVSTALSGVKEKNVGDEFVAKFAVEQPEPSSANHDHEDQVLQEPTILSNKSLESNYDLLKEGSIGIEKFAHKFESDVVDGILDQKLLGRIKCGDDADDHKASRAYDSRFLKDCSEDDDINDDIIENITKYLNKKLSQEVAPLRAPTTKEVENGRDYHNDLDDSDDDESHYERSAIFRKKINNFPKETEKERGEAFMDQVRRERNTKCTRQRRNSLYLPKRRIETDDKVIEKTKHVKALIDKQTALLEHMGNTVQKFAEMESLVKELKAESLEQKAELDNLEDLFDIVYNKYKNEISSAVEALKMQKKDRKADKKSDISSLLRDFFVPRKVTTNILDDTDDDDIGGKITRPATEIFYGKENSKDNLKKKSFEFSLPDKSVSCFDASGFYLPAVGDKFLANPKGSEYKSSEGDNVEQKDSLSLSAAEFIDKIRNKYAIVPQSPDQRAANTITRPQSGLSFMQKFMSSQFKADPPASEDFYKFRKTPSNQSSNGMAEFESPMKFEEFRMRKVHQPDRLSQKAFNVPRQNIKYF